MEENKFEMGNVVGINADLQVFLIAMAKKVGDAALVHVIQNIHSVNLGSYENYKPVVIMLADFVRKNLLGGSVVAGADESLKEAVKAFLDKQEVKATDEELELVEPAPETKKKK